MTSQVCYHLDVQTLKFFDQWLKIRLFVVVLFCFGLFVYGEAKSSWHELASPQMKNVILYHLLELYVS